MDFDPSREKCPLYVQCMVDLSIITTDPVPPDPLIYPTLEMIEDIKAADDRGTTTSCWDMQDCSDASTWSPGLWWLLNWWTWQFPASMIEVDVSVAVTTDQPAIYQVDRIIDADGSGSGNLPMGPALADLPERDQGPPPPPQVREVVEQIVMSGTGLVDLLA